MNTDDLVHLAQPGDLSPALAIPSFIVDADEDVPAVVAWFGQDKERLTLRLVVGNKAVDQIQREDLYGALGGKTLGFGDSVGWTLPGTPTTWRPIRLYCSGTGCGPFFAAKFNPKHPPNCPIHKTALRKKP